MSSGSAPELNRLPPALLLSPSDLITARTQRRSSVRLAAIRLCDETFKRRRCDSPLRGRRRQTLICSRVRRSRRGPFEAGGRRYDLTDISSLTGLSCSRRVRRVNSEDRHGAIWRTGDKDGIKLRDTQITVGMKDAGLPSASPVLTFSGATPVQPCRALATLSALRRHAEDNEHVFQRSPPPSLFKHRWEFQLKRSKLINTPAKSRAGSLNAVKYQFLINTANP